jgi:hypothetical protein
LRQVAKRSLVRRIGRAKLRRRRARKQLRQEIGEAETSCGVLNLRCLLPGDIAGRASAGIVERTGRALLLTAQAIRFRGDGGSRALREAAAKRLRKRTGTGRIAARAGINALHPIGDIVHRRVQRIGKAGRAVGIEICARCSAADVLVQTGERIFQHADLRRGRRIKRTANRLSALRAEIRQAGRRRHQVIERRLLASRHTGIEAGIFRDQRLQQRLRSSPRICDARLLLRALLYLLIARLAHYPASVSRMKRMSVGSRTGLCPIPGGRR